MYVYIYIERVLFNNPLKSWQKKAVKCSKLSGLCLSDLSGSLHSLLPRSHPGGDTRVSKRMPWIFRNEVANVGIHSCTVTNLRHYDVHLFIYHPKNVFCSIYLSRNRCCFCFEACYPTHQRDGFAVTGRWSAVTEQWIISLGGRLGARPGPAKAFWALYFRRVMQPVLLGFIWILVIAMVARIVAIILEYWYHWILELDWNYLKWGKMCLTNLLLWRGAKNLSTHHADSVQGAGHVATNMILW